MFPLMIRTTAICLLFASFGCGDRDVQEELCKGGDPKGCHNLGVMFLVGKDGPKSLKKARAQFMRACDDKYMPSCDIVGSTYYGRHDENARFFFEKGCEGNQGRSCSTLGWMLEHGEGGDKDTDQALKLYEKACELKNANGCSFAKLMKDEQRSGS